MIVSWTETPHNLTCSLRFADFQAAFSFMTQVAFKAEALQHHPRWTNVWNQVDIELSTHEAGFVVTEKDHQLAKAISTIALSFQEA